MPPFMRSLFILLLLGFALLYAAPSTQAATLTVTSLADSGPGSLREAVANAAPGDFIIFDPALLPGTITLASEILINKDLSILGPGSTQLSISGGGATRIFNISGSPSVTLADLSIRDALELDDGGAIYLDAGTLNIRNSRLINNQAVYGGALYNDNGSVRLQNTLFADNLSSDSGGAVFSRGPLVIIDSEFNSNRSSSGSGGAVYHTGPSLRVYGSSFISNDGDSGDGGAIYNRNTTAAIHNSHFISNNAISGGAIYSLSSPVTIIGSTFTNNEAIIGGGAIAHNAASSHHLQIMESTLNNNRALEGGAIAAYGNTLTDRIVNIFNSSFIRNTAREDGAAIYTDISTATFNSTFLYHLHNLPYPDATAIRVMGAGVDLLPYNTIFGGNTTCSAGVLPGLGNLSDANSDACPGLNPAFDEAIHMGPLGDNGGPTHTVPLLWDSGNNPAIDGGDDNFCLGADQRGMARVDIIAGAAFCDIGAFEYAGGSAPSFSFALSVTQMPETDSATVTISPQSHSSGGDVRVFFNFSGSALRGLDYSLSGLDADNSLLFAPNGGSQSFNINGISDALLESDETVEILMSIGAGTAGITGSNPQTLTLTDVLPPTPTAAPTLAPGLTPTMPTPQPPAPAGQPQIGVFDPALSKLGLLIPGQTGVRGERLEWLVTVTNQGSVTGTNLLITDDLHPDLQVLEVESPSGVSARVNGQRVSVSIPSLAPGQSLSFSIVTNTLRGVSVSNSACLTADQLPAPRCVSGQAVQQLPATGESPAWRWQLLTGLALLLGLGLVFSLRQLGAKG